MRYKLKQRGDTIVEVLLAMSVIGLVLGSAFGIANRNVATGQNAQERSEAIKEFETQLELLRASSGVEDNVLVDYPTTGAFCYKNNDEFHSFGDLVDVNDLDLGINYPLECQLGEGGRYKLSIIKSADYLFTIRVRWLPLGSGPTQEITTAYRIYPVGSTPLFNTTPLPEVAPIIGESVTVANITSTGAVLGGEVMSDGGAQSVERGFVYYTNPEQDPTTGTELLIGDGGVGEFSGPVSNLESDTTYYVRSFARNGSGSSYSNTQIEFKTTVALKPILGLVTTSNITFSSGRVMSTVSNNGSPITEQGVLITILDIYGPPKTNKINSVVGGDISVDITGLPPQTEYSVSTFATNAVGTTTSDPVTFSTLPLPKTIPVGTPKKYNDNYYYVSDVEYSWMDAKKFAEQSGGHLVSIGSEGENSFVSGLAGGKRIWIGLSDELIEGQWRWLSGEPVTYTNWSAGEPNNYYLGNPGEDATTMNWVGSAWNDWFHNDPKTKAYVIIEYDSKPLLSNISVSGKDFSSCEKFNSLYPCTKTDSSVYSRDNYQANYSVKSEPGISYKTLFIDYSDYTEGRPTPPDKLYNYNVNVYINGKIIVSNYQLKPSGGVVAIPLVNSVSNITSLSVEWTNNQWVPLNTYDYDPDLQINKLTLGY